uniref:MHD domain-containing protein n=1 Tax=Elaeophora elaphi TaxID=1147741 RepID=A0A0R3S102_9BILA
MKAESVVWMLQKPNGSGEDRESHYTSFNLFFSSQTSYYSAFFSDIILEKHWKSVIHRSICDYFFEAQKKAAYPEDVPPVISTPHHYLISVYHNHLYLLAVTVSETPPLMVIEFLHRVIATFVEYFEEFSDNAVKENCVMLLDEMLDNGFPLATELNVLQELIKPPNFLRTIANQVMGRTNVSEVLPTGQLSNIPWRRADVKYTNNEAYFDVIEEIDAIIDRQGATVFSEIQGYIDCCCKLSGMPDLTMSLINPRLLDDVSFHPCVRFKRWENERVLSFVPPDGNFRLLSYHIGSQNMVAIPVYVRHNISLKPGTTGRVELTVGPKQSMGKVLEDVIVEMTMPKPVQNCMLISSTGKCSFDPTTKLLQWNIGKIELGKPPTLKGTVSVSGTANVEAPPITVYFKINQLAVSGLKVNRLDLYGEKYKPFKGVKYITKAGRFQT